MNKSSISLNVMKDTIGSNVICTSIAMGLAMVVSDVGSIRDYCSEDNAIFCKSIQDFIHALQTLSRDEKNIKSMGLVSASKAANLAIPHYWNLLKSVLNGK